MKKYMLLFTAVFTAILSLYGCGNSGKEDYEAGVAAMKSGNYESASKSFEAAILKQDDQAEYFISYGMTQVQLHQYEEAVSTIKNLIRQRKL